MTVDSTSVVIDNDFLQKTFEMRQERKTIVSVLQEIFHMLGLNPVVHPLVFENEMKTNRIIADDVFENGIIKVPSWEDIHQNDDNQKQYYSFLICELYKKMFGEPLETGEKDVFSFWRATHSLGEIHSVSMCLLRDCKFFLSDDQDSKDLCSMIKNCFMKDIFVYNRSEIREKLRANGTALSRKELRSFTHQ